MNESSHAGRDVLAALRQLATSEGAEDASLAESTRAALIVIASGDPERPLPTAALDWEELFRATCRHGLVPLAQRYLPHRSTGQNQPPEAVRGMFAQTQRLIALRLAALYRGIGATLEGLLALGIGPLVLKGPAVAHLVYPEPTLRPFGDLDLLVREREVSATHRAMLAQGFTALNDHATLPPRLTPQLTAHELRYWHPERHLLVEIHIDDPFNTTLVARDLDGYWRRAVPVTIAGAQVRTLGVEDQVIQLCAHAHYHGYARLNWLTDLALLIRKYGAELDWAAFATTTRTESLQVPVYYSLCLLARTTGVGVPAAVLATLRPDPFRRWWHERYLPVPSIPAADARRPFAGFYFFPVFTRLLPDLLVMGRRGDKVRCLLRLLVPPRDWLRAYYQLPSDRPIAPHYLLHPLKLAAHALAELPPLLAAWRRGRGVNRAPGIATDGALRHDGARLHPATEWPRRAGLHAD